MTIGEIFQSIQTPFKKNDLIKLIDLNNDIRKNTSY